jgi:hypothetical protein
LLHYKNLARTPRFDLVFTPHSCLIHNPSMSTTPSPSPLQDPSKGHLQSSAKVPYSADQPSLSGSDNSLHRIKNLPGYTTPVFKGKEEQRAKVQDNVAAKVRTSAPDLPSRVLNLFF